MELDELDRAWVDAVTRDGEVVTGFLAIVTTLDEDGHTVTKMYDQTDRSPLDLMALLEYAKHRIMAAELYDAFRAADEDDDD